MSGSLLASPAGVVVDGAVDFADSPDDARFRATLRAWLAANRPARAERVPHDDASLAEEFAFLRALAAAAPRRRLRRTALAARVRRPRRAAESAGDPNEELARARAPQLLNRVGINNAGPTLIAHGTRRR